MAQRPWFRYHTETLNSRKVQSLPDALFRFWVNCMCVACESDGYLPDVDELSFLLRASKVKVSSQLNELIRRNFVDETHEGAKVHDWEHWQYLSDSSTERVRKHREKRHGNVSPTVTQETNGNVTVTPPDTDTDTERFTHSVRETPEQRQSRGRAEAETFPPPLDELAQQTADAMLPSELEPTSSRRDTITALERILASATDPQAQTQAMLRNRQAYREWHKQQRLSSSKPTRYKPLQFWLSDGDYLHAANTTAAQPESAYERVMRGAK